MRGCIFQERKFWLNQSWEQLGNRKKKYNVSGIFYSNSVKYAIGNLVGIALNL